MGLKLLHPQEVEVFYILPALRSEFAKAFKVNGMPQTKIADIMGVTASAVSQYLSDKRASGITLNGDVKRLIKDTSQKVNNQPDFIYHTQQLLNHMIKHKITCDIHKQVADVPHDCDTCFNCK